MFDPAANTWSIDLLRDLDLPGGILPEVAPPGTALGPLLPEIAAETGAHSAMVIAPGSHDTASAVAAVPGAAGKSAAPDWAYIASGTWCLVGRELAAPLRTTEALAANFTNECGVANTIRFHKNVAGLWLLQECQHHWDSIGQPRSVESLLDEAATAPPLVSLFDPDDPSLANFQDGHASGSDSQGGPAGRAGMPARIRSLCSRTGQPPPGSDAALVRAILESLALKCRVVIDDLERLTGPVRTIHLIGGGVRNPLLCQFTTDAAGRPVIAGPAEATAIGNLLTQFMARGAISSLADIRAVVRASVATQVWMPRNPDAWSAARERFRGIVSR
jgi:rhamnulokinase